MLHGEPVPDETVTSMREIAKIKKDDDEIRKFSLELDQVQQWQDTRFVQAVENLSHCFSEEERLELHQLIDAFNQMCDILKIEETVGEKSNPVFEIEKLPASASKQDLWQALEKVDEILDTVDDALGEGYLDSVMSQSYMRIKWFLLELKLKALH